MDLGLRGHVAVITGGASGIGRACAAAFAAEGARPVIWDLDGDAATRVAGELGGVGFSVDVADEASVNSALARTIEQVGPVDHAVHAAAIGSGKFGFPFTNLSPAADWPRVLKVNVMGTAFVAHALGPHIAERGRGTMVFVASIAGQIGSQTDPPYSASKAANINFAMCLAKDLAPRGVRVNTVCPGMVRTPLNRAVWQAWHDAAPPAERMSYDQWAERKIKVVAPLGRWQTPEGVAAMAVFLSSERAGDVTGQTINVDGGQVMHW
jgi:NAD(P)-dependent dehydrogenase (short-subunit alcohol dehydrogenase family)